MLWTPYICPEVEIKRKGKGTREKIYYCFISPSLGLPCLVAFSFFVPSSSNLYRKLGMWYE